MTRSYTERMEQHPRSPWQSTATQVRQATLEDVCRVLSGHADVADEYTRIGLREAVDIVARLAGPPEGG